MVLLEIHTILILNRVIEINEKDSLKIKDI